MKRAAILLTLASVLPSVAMGQTARAKTRRPDVIIIMTDDQRWDTLAGSYLDLFPNIKALMAQSTYLPNGFVPNSLCCPSRVSTLTGAYSHTTGVYGNTPPFGGFTSFRDSTTIATALQNTGYRTIFTGKYLNGYPGHAYTYVPPGWDRWFATGTGEYYNYYAADNGVRSGFYGELPSDYSGRVLTNKAIGYAQRAETKGQPYFLYYSTAAPHGAHRGSNPFDAQHRVPAPAPQDVGALSDIAPWRPVSYGQGDDVSDMPAYIRKSVWGGQTRRLVDLYRERQLEAMLGVDREIGRLLSTVDLNNTVILFMGDNGYLWGEHRWRSKQVPYDEAIRVPMFIHAPGQTAPATDGRLALNVDFAYTIAKIAGIDPTVTPIGTNSAGDPVLGEGEDLLSPSTRTDFVLEHYDHGSVVPAYCGIRTLDGWMYARYRSGFVDLYHVSVDPLEQTNLAKNPAFAAQKSALKQRAVTLCSPTPPRFSWRPRP